MEILIIFHIISNCSNNFGPNQHHEKTPLTINNIVKNKKIPVYGDGQAVRLIFVLDHVDAIDVIFHQGLNGETYILAQIMKII